MNDRCGTCGTALKPLFTSMYCPNQRCGKPPTSGEWQKILPKLPEHVRTAVAIRSSTWGGVSWFVYEIPIMTIFGMLDTWMTSPQLSYGDLQKSHIVFSINPDGTFEVIKNRHGACRLSDVPDA